MGCCGSSLQRAHSLGGTNNHAPLPQNNSQSHPSNGSSDPAAGYGGCGGGGGGVPAFSEFSFADLKAATNNFSSDYIVSESGEKAPNVVYKGRLQNQSNRRWIAVKKFTKLAWPDPKQFAVLILETHFSIFLDYVPLLISCMILIGFFRRKHQGWVNCGIKG